MLRTQIEEFCKSLGLDAFGFLPLRKFEELKPFLTMRQEKKLQNEFEEKEIEKRINPFLYMEDGKTILSIAFPYYKEGIEKQNGFSIYTKRLDYHKVVREYLNQICELIHSLGGKAEAFVDSNTLPERYIAYLAGVGFIGRNNMVITEKYGSYVFLGEIIMDLEIPCEEKHSFEDIAKFMECGDCELCYGECPTKSINAGRVNPNICLSYYTQKKELSDQEIRLLEGNVFGCDYCQLKCPYNQKAALKGLEQFTSLDFMNEELEVYAQMDNKYFKEYISTTSCGWRGKNVIRRNAILQLARQGKEVVSYQGESPYVNEYIWRVQKLFQNEPQKKEQIEPKSAIQSEPKSESESGTQSQRQGEPHREKKEIRIKKYSIKK